MEASNKIIAFKTFGKTLHNTSNDDVSEKAVSAEEEETLVGKARSILDDMEELWEIDHGTVELRDKMHLLRYYLNRMRRQSCEDNIKNQ
ncbi:MAG: hypothetical protein NT178_11480 [Proteobacteria bacterium]|nr:hypothetical protein [Pseudomonadota bacterium]